MTSACDLGDQVFQEVELGRDLGAADDRDHRPLRLLERLAERLELGLHGAAGVGGQQAREAFGRGVRAVRGRESVVDIDVAELGQLLDEGRIVLFLSLVEAGVLQQQHIAVLHRGDGFLGRFADAVVREGDMLLEDVRDARRDRLQRLLRIASLRPAEMRQQDHLAALAARFP